MEEDIYFRITQDKYQFPIGVCSKEEIPTVHGEQGERLSPILWKRIRSRQSSIDKRREACPEWVENFYSHARRILRAKGETVRSFSVAHGLPLQYFYISNYEEPEEEKIAKFCELLEVTREQLFDYNYLPDSKELTVDIYKNARAILKERGISINEFCRQKNISTGEFYNPYSKKITRHKLERFSELLGVSEEELLREE